MRGPSTPIKARPRAGGRMWSFTGVGDCRGRVGRVGVVRKAGGPRHAGEALGDQGGGAGPPPQSCRVSAQGLKLVTGAWHSGQCPCSGSVPRRSYPQETQIENPSSFMAFRRARATGGPVTNRPRTSPVSSPDTRTIAPRAAPCAKRSSCSNCLQRSPPITRGTIPPTKAGSATKRMRRYGPRIALWRS